MFECEHAVIAAALGSKTVNARRRLREEKGEAPASEKLCRELIRRFQTAINGMDVPAMVTLLGEEQPVSVLESPPLLRYTRACANDAWYGLASTA